MKFASFFLLSLAASASAFAPMSPPKTMALTASSPTALSLMSEAEIANILKKAEGCTSEECSIDQVDDLVKALKDQSKELYSRIEEIQNMVAKLEKLNEAAGAQKNEMQDTVKAIFRIFQLGDKASGNDYPSLSKPSGWSGDVGKGPTTAYDALKPKPYKADK